MALRALFPWVLVLLRPVLAAAFVVGLATGTLRDRFVLVACIAAFWADYFDGALARRWNTVTPALRKADSFADTAFYLTLAAVTWKLHRDELSAHATALILCLGSLGAWVALDAVRWRQFAGFHAWSAKLFGVGLFAVDGAALRGRGDRADAGDRLRAGMPLARRGDRHQPSAEGVQGRRPHALARAADAPDAVAPGRGEARRSARKKRRDDRGPRITSGASSPLRKRPTKAKGWPARGRRMTAAQSSSSGTMVRPRAGARGSAGVMPDHRCGAGESCVGGSPFSGSSPARVSQNGQSPAGYPRR